MTKRALVLALIGTVGTAYLVAAGCTQTQQTEQAAAVDTLAMGERMVATHGCVDCHTPGTLYGSPDFARSLSGSELGWSGAWGVSFARNLTPDPETGLGTWTEEQMVTAIRTGMRPDGRMLNPPMPWPFYSKLTDEEVTAIVKYLRSLPPVVHKVPDIVPPGVKPPAGTSLLVFPAPPAWDTQHVKPAEAGGGS